MKLRGYLALVFICLAFLPCDLYQRTILALRIRLQPHRRIEILGSWIQAMAVLVLGSMSRIGGASLPTPQRVVPTGPGTLIVMNHQSLLDIPLVVQTVEGGYPRIVTRARYHRFIPLISHMVRLYQYPVVDPSANRREMVAAVKELKREAKESDVPIAIFPEGTRGRDGEIGPFKTRGLEQILKTREWQVHIFVADGFWKTARFTDFLKGMGRLEGQMTYLGRVDWSNTEADAAPFIDELRARMIEGLSELRQEAVHS